MSQHLHAPPLRGQFPTLPASAEQVVFHALSKQPQEPYPRMADFAIALQAASQQHGVPPLITSSFSPVPLPSTKADRPASMEIRAITQPSSNRTVSAEIPANPLPLTPAPVSRPVLHRRVPNRRALFTLVLVLLVALRGGGIYSSFRFLVPTPTPQAMFGFDAAHTHSNPDEHTLNPDNVSHLKLQWSFSTGDATHSSPTVAGGMVYVGSVDHNLYAFDASCRQSCLPLWSFSTGDEIDSSPAVAGGIVYVGSLDHKLYAFDASCRQSCQPLWNFATGDSIFSSPMIANGTVYVGSNDHKLYAFDVSCRKDCQPLWTFATGSSIDSSPAVANGMHGLCWLW